MGYRGHVEDDVAGTAPESDFAQPQPDVASEPLRYGGAGLRLVLVVGVALTVLGLVLAVQNTDNTIVQVFAAEYRAPLVVVVLVAAIAGAILGELFSFVWRHQRSRRRAELAELRRLRQTR